MIKEFVKWQKNFSVGIKEIDEQHKHFIKILNKVHSKLNLKNEDVVDELNELIEYARIHFTTEEKYFDSWRYPYEDEHKIIHAQLTLDVLKFKEKFDGGQKVLKDLTDFLKDWFVHHLKVYDGKYARYIKENNLI
jgi:hemerythrin-like metal-binding protein